MFIDLSIFIDLFKVLCSLILAHWGGILLLNQINTDLPTVYNFKFICYGHRKKNVPWFNFGSPVKSKLRAKHTNFVFALDLKVFRLGGSFLSSANEVSTGPTCQFLRVCLCVCLCVSLSFQSFFQCL